MCIHCIGRGFSRIAWTQRRTSWTGICCTKSVFLFDRFQLQQQIVQPQLDGKLLWCTRWTAWVGHPTTLEEGCHVPRLPTAAAIVSTGGHSSHELLSAPMDAEPLQLGSGLFRRVQKSLLLQKAEPVAAGIDAKTWLWLEQLELLWQCLHVCFFLRTFCAPTNTNLSSNGFVGKWCAPKDTPKPQLQ